MLEKKPHKNNAFTLAEILITVAIIGIVASLTIAVVSRNFQKQILYGRFIKAYNTFNKAYFLMKAEGYITGYSASDAISTRNAYLQKLKYTIKCGAQVDTICRDITLTYKSLDGSTLAGEGLAIGTVYSTPDGVDFKINTVQISGTDLFFVRVLFDTNGIEKAPNVLGRDLFEIDFYPHLNLPGFNPNLYSNYSELRDRHNTNVKLQTSDVLIKSYCNPQRVEPSLSGVGCSCKLLIDKKMNY